MKPIKSSRIDARVTDDTVKLLNECCANLNISQSTALQIAITMLHDSVFTNDSHQNKRTEEGGLISVEKEKLDTTLMLRVSTSEKEIIRQFCKDNNTSLLNLIRLGMEYISKQK